MRADQRGNPFPKAFPIGEGGSRVPRKRETDEGFLPCANVKCKMQNEDVDRRYHCKQTDVAIRSPVFPWEGKVARRAG